MATRSRFTSTESFMSKQVICDCLSEKSTNSKSWSGNEVCILIKILWSHTSCPQPLFVKVKTPAKQTINLCQVCVEPLFAVLHWPAPKFPLPRGVFLQHSRVPIFSPRLITHWRGGRRCFSNCWPGWWCVRSWCCAIGVCLPGEQWHSVRFCLLGSGARAWAAATCQARDALLHPPCPPPYPTPLNP